MQSSRQLLPSISLLTTFEAVCRTGSTIAAARDLNMSQGAVSRLIQNLEAQLGAPLFKRVHRRLTPTEAAISYMQDVTKALKLIRNGSMQVRSSAGKSVLALSVPTSLGACWLVPRLPNFINKYQNIMINLGTQRDPFDFEKEGFDAAIHSNMTGWTNANSYKLFEERIIAVCAPNFLHHHSIVSTIDMINMPLLRLYTQPDIWNEWFLQQDIEVNVTYGMSFDEIAMMIQATIHGIGIALLPEFVAHSLIIDGHLINVHGLPSMSGKSYYLIWPKHRIQSNPLLTFRTWLLNNIQRELVHSQEETDKSII